MRLFWVQILIRIAKGTSTTRCSAQYAWVDLETIRHFRGNLDAAVALLWEIRCAETYWLGPEADVLKQIDLSFVS